MKYQMRNAVRVKRDYLEAFYKGIDDGVTFNKKPDTYFNTIKHILEMEDERLEALDRYDTGGVRLYEIKDITSNEIEAAQFINNIHNSKTNVIEVYSTIGDDEPILSNAMYCFQYKCVRYCFETDLVKPKHEEHQPAPFEYHLENDENDPVNSPAHYTYGKIEVIDYILDKELDFCLGNVIKYVSRAGHKNNTIEDLQKAARYLEIKINELKTKESE